MAISDSQKTHINRMNRAYQNVSLGTIIQTLQSASATQTTQITALQSGVMGVSGSRVAGGSEVSIYTGSSNPKGWIVQSNRSGSRGTLGLYAVSGSDTGYIKVSSASGNAALNATDVITYIAFY
jgi:hypothetical protein